jgi:hypothetical protein
MTTTYQKYGQKIQNFTVFLRFQSFEPNRAYYSLFDASCKWVLRKKSQQMTFSEKFKQNERMNEVYLFFFPSWGIRVKIQT